MKRLLLLFLFVPVTLFSQRYVSVSDSIFQYFDIQSQVFPQEKLHLHTDRDLYVPGEKIWFKAYLMDAATHRSSTQSRYVYVELISPVDTLVHRVMVRPEDDIFHGYLPITEIIPDGIYTLRAYTRYMENLGDDYFFKKPVRIGNLAAAKSADADNNNARVANPREQTTNLREQTGRSLTLNSPFSTLNSFDVSFFPEGGNLLEGILSKVAFKALNSDGTPASITGEIVDEAGVLIASVASFYAGMGSFAFVSESGKKYRLTCRNGAGLEKQFDLPQSHPNAHTLVVYQQYLRKRLAVEVRKSANTPDIPCYLFVHCRGESLYFDAWDRSNPYVVFHAKDLPAGVIHLILFDEKMNPLSERLVFNTNNEDSCEVDFRTDKAIYGRREKVVTSLSLSSSDGRTTSPDRGRSPRINDNNTNDGGFSGHFSIAITDDADSAVDPSTSILSTLLLSSELKGYIDHPAFYLQDDITSMVALDYLMMTHGWRRYNVPEVAKGKMELPQIPYQTSQQLAGSVKNLFSSRPVSGNEVLIIAEQNMGLLSTDERGRFTVQDFEYPDSTSYFVQARERRGGFRLKLTLDDELFPPLTHTPQSPFGINRIDNQTLNSPFSTLNSSETFLAKAEQRSQYDENMRTIYLDEVVVTAPIIKKERRSEFWANISADKTIRREDLGQWNPVLVSDILLRMGGIKVDRQSGAVIISGMQGLPLVYVDGMLVGWPEELLSPYDSPIESAPADIVESIDIFTFAGASIFGTRGAGGVISITTKRGMDVAVERDYDNNTIFTPLGYQKPVEFYSPKYETLEAKAYGVPDYRTTIFWKPDMVISNEQEEAIFDFYTSDFATTYSVVIEGLTTDGKIVRQVEKIKIE